MVMRRLNKFDYSDYDVIVFDEIYFHNVGKWALIWDFVRTILIRLY